MEASVIIHSTLHLRLKRLLHYLCVLQTLYGLHMDLLTTRVDLAV